MRHAGLIFFENGRNVAQSDLAATVDILPRWKSMALRANPVKSPDSRGKSASMYLFAMNDSEEFSKQ
ncbi:MAG TPA: hypothetical protein DEO49_05645 [Sutterella sp.]|nr:hypothetical protein [Sutterella sp.]